MALRLITLINLWAVDLKSTILMLTLPVVVESRFPERKIHIVEGRRVIYGLDRQYSNYVK